MMNTPTDAAALVNLSRYPIAEIASDEGAACAERYRREYLANGLCALPEFISPGPLQRLVAESNAVAGDAYFCKSTHNAYLTEDDGDVPAEDIAKRREKTFVGSVAYDRLGNGSLLRALYLWDPLKSFIGSVIGKPELHRLADPLGACSINVFVDGGEHGWHFDESEFTVTLMLQRPESGGAFEYVTGIRGAGDEKSLLAGVLNGDRSRVVQLDFLPGTLLIFGGRQTIHRLTRVQGSVPRLVPILCFSEKPGQVNSESVRKLFWGRTGNETAAAV